MCVNNRKISAIIILSMMMIAIFSCSEAPADVITDVNFIVNYENKSLSTVVKAPDDTVIMTLSVGYIEITGGLEKSVMEQMNNDFYNAAKTEFDNTLAEYSDEVLQMYDDGFPYMPYEFDTTVTVTYAENDILSVISSWYTYLGGAHPNTIQTSYTYNITTGELMSPDDITGDAFDAVGQAKQLFTNSINEEPEEYFENAIELLDEAMANVQFNLYDDSLVFYLNTYEIAPYSSGVISVSIPFEVD